MLFKQKIPPDEEVYSPAKNEQTADSQCTEKIEVCCINIEEGYFRKNEAHQQINPDISNDTNLASTFIIKDFKKKKYDGSLLRLFQSELFNVHLIINHLLRSKNKGTVDYLVNRLYEEKIEDIDFYLPQLCFLAVSQSNKWKSLIKFLLDSSIKFYNFGIKAMMYLSAYSDDEECEFKMKASELMCKIEIAIVNRETPDCYKITDNFDFWENINDDFSVNFHRDVYKNEQLKFIDIFKLIPIDLKNIDIEHRKDAAKLKLARLNNWIINDLRRNKSNGDEEYEIKFQGIMLPFSESDNCDPSIILNIAVDMARCFNTNKRAPVLIVFETINYSEAQQKKDTLLSITDNDFKRFEKELNDKILRDIDTANKKLESTNSEEISNEENIYNQLITSRLEEIKDPSDQLIMQHIKENYIKVNHNCKHFCNLKRRRFDKSNPNEIQNFNNLKEHMENDNSIDKNNLTDHCFCYKEHFESQDNEDFDQVVFPRNRETMCDRANFALDINNIKKSKHSLVEESTFEILTTEQIEEIKIEYGLKQSKNSNKVKSQLESELKVYLDSVGDPFGREWSQIETESKQNSIYCEFETYKLKSVIFKSDDDLRQELLAIQLMKRLKNIFNEANISLYLRPYEITITSCSSGYIECIPNTISIDSLIKSFPEDKNWTLCDFFSRYFNLNFEEHQKNFVESLAGYSFFCYLFNIKDRHNGNILLDNKGHIVHIDFGFMLSNSPGIINLESVPFKLTQDYIDIMGGVDSEMFEYFKSLLCKAFYEVRKHLDEIISLIEIMFKGSNFKCFQAGDTLFQDIRDRLSTRFNVGDNIVNEFQELIDNIISESLNNWGTIQYDYIQRWTNGIEF